MSRTTLLFLALLGLAPACAKGVASAEMASSAPDSYGGSGGGDSASAGAPAMDYDDSKARTADYERQEVSVSAASESPPTAVTAAPSRSGPAAPQTPPGEPRIAEPKPKPVEAKEGQADGDNTDPKKQYARQIIYTAEIYKLDDAMQRAEELTLAAGGYVQNMSQGYYVLRIPAPALRGVMDELARLGVVEARSLQARDVSEEYVDLTTRIRVLRETQQQLLVLLKQARNVDEALKVRESVDRITMELEQATGRLRLLESLIGFSTLTVRMSQRGPQNTIPSSNDPFPWVDGLGVEATEWN
jgi:hypothetical protein